MDEDNFLLLKNLVDGESCTISIRTNDPFVHITNISVVSEVFKNCFCNKKCYINFSTVHISLFLLILKAQLFEIYGKHEEYIKTCRSDYLTDVNGIDIYVGQSSLLTSHEITIKVSN